MEYAGEKAKEFRRGWPPLLAATLGNAAGVSTVPFYSLGSFIAPLQTEFGWSRGDVSSAFLYTTTVLVVISPILGMLIDRFGVRILALVSIPLLSGVLVALSFIDGSVVLFHGLYGLAALVGGGTTPINYTRVVNDTFDKARGLALGISLAAVAMTAIGLPLLLAGINQSYSWRTGYLALAILALLPLPFVLLGIGKHEPKRSVRTQDDAVVESGIRSPTFWIIGISFGLIAIAVSALVVHMVPLLRDAGMSPMAAASTASIIGFGVLGGRLVTGYLIDRIFAPYVAAPLFLSTAAGSLLLLYGGPSTAFVAAGLIGLSLGAEVDLIAYMTARYFGMARYGFNYAIIYVQFVLGAAVGPALAGRAFDLFGNYNIALGGIVTLLVAGSVGILCLPRFETVASRYHMAH